VSGSATLAAVESGARGIVACCGGSVDDPAAFWPAYAEHIHNSDVNAPSTTRRAVIGSLREEFNAAGHPAEEREK
jgi:hypothetical protein